MSLYQLEASRGFDGINRKEGVIRGVSVIEGGIEAVGHSLHVDDCCVRQMHDLAVEMGSVPVKLNHGSGADAVVGYLNNFRQDDNRLRADLNLIDWQRLGLGSPEMAFDLPTGGKRLIQKALGYRQTMVAGQTICADGELTGELPGRLVRGARPAP